MKAAIAAARHRILVEFYIVEDDGVAAEFGELLMRKAAEGVSVALMYDSVGSLGTEKAFFDRLRSGGVAVCAFNPINPLERPGHWGLIQRNHRKVLAVDSDIAFTGGINLSNVYAKGSFGSGRQRPPSDDADSEGWRDTQVELQGPVVGALAAVFRESWARQGCEGTLPPAPPARVAAPGQRVVKLVAGDPEHGINPTYTALLRAIDAAKDSVQLTMAYFAPGSELIEALCDAARRGVAVSLVLPGRSDVTLVLHAARARYAQLLEAGVQIHEMSHAVMHAKTAVIDGVFSSVGSSNMDWRSIVGNNEIDVIVLGDDFGQQMQALFARDVAASKAIQAEQWARRGIGQRLLEGFARIVEPLL
jgi:cardiolipin synthase